MIRGELGKTNQERRGRIIPISKHLAQELANWPRDGALVLPGVGRSAASDRTASCAPFRDAWAAAGVSREVWARRPHHAFRRGMETGLVAAGASYEAVEALVGHALGGAGRKYVDTRRLKLREAVDLIPKCPHHSWDHLKGARTDGT